MNMATEMEVFNPAQLPAFARNRKGPSALSKALAGGGGGGYQHRLSIKGGVFRLLASGKEIASIEERYLDVVIVNATPKVGRIFYGVKFSESESAAPKCQSVDGVKPDAGVTEKQHDNCAACPMNIKGSGDGETKGCRYFQRVALVLANDMKGNVLQLTVPSKSLFGKEENGNYPLQAYARWLEAQGIDPDLVVTRIKFDTRESSPKLFFRTVRYLADAEFAVVQEKAESQDAKDAIDNKSKEGVAEAPQLEAPKGPQFPPDEDVDEAPAPKAKKPKKKVVEEEDEAEEPPVRKSAAAPAAPAAKPLSAVVDDWDTDD
tara:strand:- start:331 stop:1284 length:954 start_codon:yes stop_codon:yes gene_type:complete